MRTWAKSCLKEADAFQRLVCRALSRKEADRWSSLKEADAFQRLVCRRQPQAGGKPRRLKEADAFQRLV